MSFPADIHALNQRFSLPDIATLVAGEGGLAKLRIDCAVASAEIYLHGAQVTSWKPAGAEEVLFLSAHSKWEDGRAIRGGIPVCFPWFRAKTDNAAAPAHGVVRTRAWELASLTCEGENVVVSLVTESDEASRKWWPFAFRLEHRITVGKELRLELIVTNTGADAFTFAEALHTYHLVSDVRTIRVEGLDGVHFFDNVDANREKVQQGEVVITQATDNAYADTRAAITLMDPGFRRTVHIAKKDSSTTVVWNPWQAGAQAMADLGDDEWQHFACVEACNILDDSVTLAPGATHTLEALISITNYEPA